MKVVRTIYFGAGAGEIRTEHDHPWRVVIEVFSAGLETILK